jgi:lipopolysaccharide export system protein LptA/lipopolysaccharide export system protein LptC
MRTTEAARYARWSAAIAFLLVVLVACVYGARDWQSRQARKRMPAAVPSSVEQRSAGFTFSKVVGDRTEFTVRASHATEFVEGGRSLLEDVWITAYGGAGERFDNLHTRTCDYLTASESTSCAGDVQIELDRASDPQAQKGVPANGSRLVHVTTSHVSFDHKTGLATTDRPVTFQFSQGEGQGVGFRYEAQHGEIQLLSAVELALHQADPPGHSSQTSTPVLNLSGSSMTFDRDQRLIHLVGPVHARQANFDLACGKLDVELDEHMYAHRLIATEQPELQNIGPSHMSVTAETITALASPTRIEAIIAEGQVHAIAQNPTGQDQLQADRVETELDAISNQPKQLVASGNVAVRSNRAGAVRNLETSMLHLDFAPSKKGGELHVKHALTPAGTIELQDSGTLSGKPAQERMRLAAQHLEADFTGQNDLRELRGSEGVHFERQIGKASPQTTISQEMVAQFAPGGGWSIIDQTGNVQLHQDNESAQAERAHFERTSDTTLLERSVVLTDATSRTTARSALFDQTTNEFHAIGRVATVESSSGGSQFVNFAPGPGRVSGERLDANSATGHEVYSGNARLWQGDSIVEGEIIELDRQTHILTATGQVHAVFPQAAAPNHGQAGSQTRPSKPEFWHAEGNHLIYLSDESRGRMEEKVHAHSEEGSMTADAMDFFFAPSGSSATPDASATGKLAGGPPNGTGTGQQLIRASGFGSVNVEQQGRHGKAARADYTAEDGRFVLSGGTPTAYDASGNATQGRQLTFFFGDDSINIDSAEGLRTLTLHQVQK